MQKKGQGISINTIVIAAVAVIVLIVLAAILVSQSSRFSRTVSNCEEVGGTCKLDTKCADPVDGFHKVTKDAVCLKGTGKELTKTGETCCLPGLITE
jgi:hypothetical protein